MTWTWVLGCLLGWQLHKAVFRIRTIHVLRLKQHEARAHEWRSIVRQYEQQITVMHHGLRWTGVSCLVLIFALITTLSTR